MSTLADRLGAARLRPHPRRGLPGATAAEAIIAYLRRCRRRAQGRAELARLSERELRDIGLTSAEAQWESAKPFWRG